MLFGSHEEIELLAQIKLRERQHPPQIIIKAPKRKKSYENSLWIKFKKWIAATRTKK